MLNPFVIHTRHEERCVAPASLPVAGGIRTAASRRHYGLTKSFFQGTVAWLLLTLATQAIAAEYEIEENGRAQTFEQVDEPVAGRQSVAEEPAIVLYEKNARRTESSRRVATRRILVELKAGVSAKDVADSCDSTVERELPFAPRHFVFEAASARTALDLAPKLSRDERVISARPLLGRRRDPRSVPNDPLFPDQWGLLNTGQNGALPGVDLNITNVWETYRGKGIYVAVVDDGVKYTHPDLSGNYDTTIDYDYYSNDDTPLPSFDKGHGTAAAGIIAARGNNLTGLAGVAYEATLVGIRLLGGPDETEEMEASSLTHSNQVISIYSNGWGPIDNGHTIGETGTLVGQALLNGITQGRGGKGSIFVWGAGNGGTQADNANYDGYANSIYTIATGALTDRGGRAFYSEPGACLVISGPGGRDIDRPQGITTIDLIANEGFNKEGVVGDYDDRNYTKLYAGTSASAPFLAGVVALMLEANPNLGWRDVQEILIRTARRNDPLHLDWVFNGAGLHFNHDYGAGLADTDAAVKLARAWQNLKPQTNFVSRQTFSPGLGIPDNNPAGATRQFDLSNTDLRVEFVTLKTTINHPFRGDLAIKLISPGGMVSRLAELHGDFNANIVEHKFMSVFDWGESSRGVWTVNVSDLKAGDVGSIELLELEVFGTPMEPLIAPTLALKTIANSPSELQLAGSFGRNYLVQTSTDLGNWTDLLRTNAPISQFKLMDIEPSGSNARFYRAVALP